MTDTKRSKAPPAFKPSALPEWAQDVLSALPPLSGRPDAAKTLGVSTKTLDRRIRSGDLEHVKHGGRVLIPRMAIVAMLVAGAV